MNKINITLIFLIVFIACSLGYIGNPIESAHAVSSHIELPRLTVPVANPIHNILIDLNNNSIEVTKDVDSNIKLEINKPVKIQTVYKTIKDTVYLTSYPRINNMPEIPIAPLLPRR